MSKGLLNVPQMLFNVGKSCSMLANIDSGSNVFKLNCKIVGEKINDLCENVGFGTAENETS